MPGGPERVTLGVGEHFGGLNREHHGHVVAMARAAIADFCSSVPVEKQTASSTHAATTGVTCGRPSARTVEIQTTVRPALWMRLMKRAEIIAASSCMIEFLVQQGGGA
jgi:hypothetical protein